MRASSSSEVDETTLDLRRAGNTGGWTLSCLDGPSESCGWDVNGERITSVSTISNSVLTKSFLDDEHCRTVKQSPR